MPKLPLEGIRVADFSWILNGPQIALWLASMGAEVIKIESQVYLDLVRRAGDPLPSGETSFNNSGAFHALNYGKKSVNLNVASPKGRELAYDLIRKSDIVLECYTRPVAKKLGVTYEDLIKVKEDLIVISCSLLGRTGLHQADWTGWGMMAVAYVGQCDAQGYPGGQPRQTGGTWPDYGIGTAVLFHALAALYRRKFTGKGDWIDVSMAEVCIGEMPEWYMDYFMNGRDRRGWANRDDIMAPHNTYRCQGDDKWIAIAVGNDEEWNALRGVMGNPSWANDEKFADQVSRWRNRDEIDAHVNEWTRGCGHIELAHRLQAAGVAAGPVLDSVEVVEDPHLWDWGYWWKLNHHEAGEHVLPGIPAKMSAVPQYNYGPPPDLGQHNKEVLCGILGLSEKEVDELAKQRVVY